MTSRTNVAVFFDEAVAAAVSAVDTETLETQFGLLRHFPACVDVCDSSTVLAGVVVIGLSPGAEDTSLTRIMGLRPPLMRR